MGNPFRIVLACLTLALATEISAQQIMVYSVEGWPRMGTRADGKLEMLAFSHGFLRPAPAAPGAPAGRFTVHDFSMTIMSEDPIIHFLRAAAPGTLLKSVLIESYLPSTPKGGPAPFAMRLSDVTVTSVQTGGSMSNERLTANVSLQPAKIEVFTTTQGPTGKPGPVNRFGYDVRAGKTF